MAEIKSFYSPTPKKWRKIGDAVLWTLVGLQPIIVGADFIPDKTVKFVLFAMSIVGVIVKAATNLASEPDTE